MSKHTPAPWTIEKSRSEEDSKCIVARGSNLAVVFFRTHEEQANAKLIAAAPDVLEALSQLLLSVAIAQTTGEPMGPNHEHVVAAREAIAKAETSVE